MPVWESPPRSRPGETADGGTLGTLVDGVRIMSAVQDRIAPGVMTMWGELDLPTGGLAAQPAAGRIRPYSASDRLRLERVLALLPSLYPDGDRWLRRRLDEVEEGAAQCTVVEQGSRLIAVAIET